MVDQSRVDEQGHAPLTSRVHANKACAARTERRTDTRGVEADCNVMKEYKTLLQTILQTILQSNRFPLTKALI